MVRPQNKKEAPAGLSFITYLQQCLPNMSEISAPIRKLLEKDMTTGSGKPQEEN
ncbi:hypothetical protein DPMN_022586 [Dreissena polymorpha]|uniref:Uncharacterized protein n=1 Tax=Dreissena polymorpha TaxID=45954 RepID=A0A9D4NKM0_DREPO|nr:hypothetical protein DPMN_020833 [Dreissena polymorpha]KAH3898357.1 hypothetical protein DPMN_022586 [Dreissena polymorpha]